MHSINIYIATNGHEVVTMPETSINNSIFAKHINQDQCSFNYAFNMHVI